MTNQRSSYSGCLIGLAVLAILALIVGPASFAAGVVAERTGVMPGSVANRPVEGGQAFAILWEARKLIDDNYVDRPAINDQSLAYGAVSGMVDALGDTGHSRFMTPEEIKSEQDSLSGAFEGIGATMTYTNGHAVVVSPLDGSPAQKAGLQPGDVVVAVDGKNTADMTLSEIIALVRGPKGTKVVLSVIHPSNQTTTDIEIVRATIALVNVSSQLLPGTQVLLVRVASFSDGVGEDLKKALVQGQADGATKVILDLRNSPGGLLSEAVNVASQFLISGNVMLQQNAQGQQTPLPVRGGAVAPSMPMVVLINQGTASAAEIVSGALQDRSRAQLVGVTTFGTGTVLSTFKLQDGSALLLATQQWLTPNGRLIWHTGIKPDIEVELPAGVAQLTPAQAKDLSAAQLRTTGDVQLLRGLQVLDGNPNAASAPRD